MKVKKFRVKPRIKQVARLLKTEMGGLQLTADVLESLPKESDKFLSQITPLAFYQTWAIETLPPLLKEAIDAAGWKKCIAVSALVATIGSEPEESLSESLMHGETMRSQIVTALSEETTDQSLMFLKKLLVDDAKVDDCDISELQLITESRLLMELLPCMKADQEGISVDQSGHMAPRFTRVALASWFPMAKKKRQPHLSGKRTS